MNRRFPKLRALLIFVAVGAVASCSDTTDPVSVHDGPVTPAMSVQDISGGYVVGVSNGRFAAISAAIVDMGGTVVRSHPQVGIVIASGLSDAAAAGIQAMNGVQTMTADVMIDGVPGADDLMTESAGVAGHDPSQAFFYQVGYQWDMQIIDADDAWAAGASGAGVTVAILDTGIDPYHQDLAGLVDASRSIAFVPNANPSIPAWADDHYHGTHVAGTVASNGLGTSGVAPHTTLMAVKICGAFFGCPFSAIVSGILHAADNGANIINMSLGGFVGKSFPGGGQLNALLNRVVNYAAGKDVLVVSAAGNDALDLDHLGRDFGAGSFVATPCESGNGMCISATNWLDQLAGYSNFGRSAVNIAAPGGDGGFPVLAPCSSVSVIIPPCASGNRYLWLAGTSMATPHVAGAAAVLAGQGVTKPAQMRTILQRTADDLGKKGTDALYSKGRLNVLSAMNN